MKTLLASVALLATLGAPVQAFDINNMSEADKDAFGAAVRAYLLENPEVILEAYEIYEQRQAVAEAASDQQKVAQNAAALFEDPRAWEAGNPEGDIVMVEFLDYRCGYCRKAHEDVKALINTDRNIRFIVKEFPILGDESVLASRFAIATRLVAGDEAYGKVNDALMTFKGSMTEASLAKLAGKLDLDGDAILARINDPEVSQLIADNHQLASKLSITGTPTFVMQDQMLRGYVPLANMQQLVSAMRAEM